VCLSVFGSDQFANPTCSTISRTTTANIAPSIHRLSQVATLHLFRTTQCIMYLTLLPHRRRSALSQLCNLRLLLVDALVHEFCVIRLKDMSEFVVVQAWMFKTYRSLLSSLRPTTLESLQMTLVLEALGSDEALNTRCFGVWLGAFLLRLHFTADDEFTNLVVDITY